jgi:integrase
MSLKSKSGSVTINTYRGTLRLRLPRSIAGGVQLYLYTGLTVTSQNTRSVQVIALQIESDIEAKCFDTTLETYKQAINSLKGTQQVEIVPKKLTLNQVWDKYCEFKESQLANTTYHKDFLLRYQNIIHALPSKKLTDAIAIRDYLVENHSAGTAKRLLMQFNACCRWAKKSGLIADNPFTDLTADIRVKRWDTNKIDPFTSLERDAIITAFESDTQYKHYSSFVKFLFSTGCRIGEAIALQWKHVSRDCSEVYFCESYSHLYGRKTTKTGENRKFPCNNELKALLISLKPQQFNQNWLVFPSHTDDKEIKVGGFIRIWKGYDNRGEFMPGIVSSLIDKGLVSRYRPPYNARHTFISMCLEKGVSVQQIARWCGNSPEVIYQHYAGITQTIEVPEL